MGGVELTPEGLRLALGKLILLILAICVHEFGHAFVATKLGDETPSREGRVTLNPFAHADPIGTLALPGLALLFTNGSTTGFGWGKPVTTNPVRYTRRFHMRTGTMFVGFAGPFMNIVFGTVIALGLFALLQGGAVTMAQSYDTNHWSYLLRYGILMNYTLFFFNLIPSPPLDGGHVIQGLLPRRALAMYSEIAKYGIFILMAFMLSPTLARIFLWPAMKLYGLVAGSLLGIV
jgi:Zn-dependent protease